ncbi:peroxisomal sarcosine oxidase-like isoform X1 [Asterias amurensis]|uniref:peroxisomal sarcosine oxidase-like isoform X1 n=1 Tax=Asterias amurensis TaxID=7602 RepID=UPI003AB4781E
MADIYDCIVIGAGVLGSSSAYQLSKDGYKVLLLDQFTLPHSRGSSHGAVRIICYPYTDPRRQAAMPEQHQMWSQLEKELSTSLTHEAPCLIITTSRNKWYTSTLNGAKLAGYPCTEFSQDQFRENYTELNFPGCCAFRHDLRIIDAHKAVQGLQNQFVKNGGTLLDGEKVMKIDPGKLVTVHTSNGHQFKAKGVVLTAGLWASKLLKPLGLDLPLKTWRVNVCYFREKEPGSLKNMPFLRYASELDVECCSRIVAFPSREYPGLVKLNYHVLWNEVDPDCRDKGMGMRQVDIEEMKKFVRSHIPGLEREPAIVEPCMYTCTPNETPIIGSHPLHPNIAIACGMSGSGFKMAPLAGKVLGEMAMGNPPSFDTSLLGIDNFLPGQKSKL